MKLRYMIAFWALIFVSIALLLALWGNEIWLWMLKNQDLAAGFLTTAVLLGGLIFAYLQLNDIKKDRHAQILLSLSHDWRSEEMQKARGEIGRKILEREKTVKEQQKNEGQSGEAQQKEAPDHSTILATLIDKAFSEDPKMRVELTNVADFFEDMGLLVGKKFIRPPELVLEGFGDAVIFYWELYKETVSLFRKKFQSEDIFEWFEYLHKISKAFIEAKRTTSLPPEKRPSAKVLFRNLSDKFE